MTLVSSVRTRARTTTGPAARLALVAAGALVVSLAAQVAVPLPLSPVPVTLQPMAVLLVGGLLGARLGAASLVLYLVLGAAGLPVFTPFGAPGLARLLGPTGGYLLAFPAAAALVGRLTPPPVGWPRLILGVGAAVAAIYAGGLAQLWVLTGDPARAVSLGLLPFLASDLLKGAVAALVLRRLIPLVRLR